MAHRVVEMDLHDIMAKRAHRTPRTGERSAIAWRDLDMARWRTPVLIASASDAVITNFDGQLKMANARVHGSN